MRLHFDSKGGSAVAAIRVKKGSRVTLPPPPTKAGYTFGGWYTDSQAGATPFVATTPINANLPLYAKWNAVTSCFYLNNASVLNVKRNSAKIMLIVKN